MYRAIRPFVAAALCIVSIECTSDSLLAPLSPPTLSSIGPASGVRGTTVTLELTGANFVSRATIVAVSGGGVVQTGVNVSSATSASVSLAIDANAALGSRNVTVVTAGGSSAAMTFVVNPPVPSLTSVLPAVAMRGTTQTVTVAGTNFVTGATTVVVSGAGASVRNVNVSSATLLTADLAIDADAATGDRTVAISTAGGTSGTVPLSITAQPPTLSSVSPAVGVTNMIVDETLKGAHFVGGATVLVSGDGVTPTNVVVVNDSTITARFLLLGDATLGAHTVTVMTAGGMSSGATFTVNPPPATATTVTPNNGVRGSSTVVSISGSNFVVGGTSVAVAGPGVTVSNVVVSSSTSLTATFTVDTAATLGAHSIAVITAGGSTGGLSFTVNAPPPTLTNAPFGTAQRGETISLTLTGTGFVPGGTTVNVSGAGVTVGTVNVTSSTSLTVLLVIGAAADLGFHDVTVATSGGTSLAVSIHVGAPAPTLASITPPSALQGTAVAVTLTGTNLSAGTATIAVSGTGVVASNVVVVNATTITATLTIDVAATSGAHAVTVTNLGGTTGAQTFTVGLTTPTLSSISPSSGALGTSVAVTLTGSSFDAAGTTVQISGTGVTAGAVSVVNGQSLTTTFTVDATAALGARNVTVTTAAGTSAAQTFAVTGTLPTLASVAPAVGVQGNTVAVTLTGTAFLAGGTTVAVNGTGVTVSNVNVTSGTSLTANFVLASGATLGAHSVTVSTNAGASGAQTFTVNPPPPTLTTVAPNTGAQTGSQTVTLTGTNFVPGATTLSISGLNVTVSNVVVASSTSLTATFAVDAGAAIGARDVKVTTTGGTSGPQTFTVVVSPTISTFGALATHLRAVQPARLRWATSNATTCSIDNGVGVVSTCNDSLFVTPGTTKSYKLSATAGGVTVTASVTLFANEPGRFVYSTSSGGAAGTHVHQFSMDATTGDLTAIGSGTITSGNGPTGIAVDPSGSWAYVANTTSNSISMYSIDVTTGALTSRGTIAAGTGPRELVVDPAGRFLYVSNATAGGISQYAIDPTGLLVANGTTPLGLGPRGIAIEGTGRFLYATNATDNTIQEFSINADGTLSSLGTLTTSATPYEIAADPAGRFLYLSHHTTGRLSQYRIEANGTLTLLGSSVLSSPAGTIDAVTIDPTGRFAYAVDFNNAIFHEFSIDQTTGILTRFAAPTLPFTFPAVPTTVQFAIDPQGKFAFGTYSLISEIGLFTIDANGVLAPVTAPLRTIAGGSSPSGIVVSP